MKTSRDRTMTMQAQEELRIRVVRAVVERRLSQAEACRTFGVGKTSAIRNLCRELPRPDFQVVYLCDTSVSPLALYRQLAFEFGVTPSHRRAQLWHDLKAAMLDMVDDKATQPILVIDE